MSPPKLDHGARCDSRTLLVDVLREELGLTGTHVVMRAASGRAR